MSPPPRLIDQERQPQPAAGRGLGVDGAQVRLDGAFGDAEPLGDLQVGQPLGHQAGDLVFPVGQVVQGLAARAAAVHHGPFRGRGLGDEPLHELLVDPHPARGYRAGGLAQAGIAHVAVGVADDAEAKKGEALVLVRPVGEQEQPAGRGTAADVGHHLRIHQRPVDEQQVKGDPLADENTQVLQAGRLVDGVVVLQGGEPSGPEAGLGAAEYQVHDQRSRRAMCRARSTGLSR